MFAPIKFHIEPPVLHFIGIWPTLLKTALGKKLELIDG